MKDLLKGVAILTTIMAAHSHLILPLNAQTIPIEGMVGSRNYWHQHTINKKIGKSKFGFSHVSTLHAFYHPSTPTELMSQSYLTYALFDHFKLSAGVFYATGPGFKPSINIQISRSFKHVFLLLVPRIDVWKNPSYDVMFLLEYRPPINKHIGLYTRFQTMVNLTGDQHNRSYQNIRLGVSVFNFQLGFAANFDAYGKDVRYYPNLGVFIKKDL